MNEREHIAQLLQHVSDYLFHATNGRTIRQLPALPTWCFTLMQHLHSYWRMRGRGTVQMLQRRCLT